MRGATTWPPHFPASAPYFNPRTPCGVRPRRHVLHIVLLGISIHAPRAGCDEKPIEFYFEVQISIHAPRAGCDLSQPSSCQPNSDFNPRTPCGVRLMSVLNSIGGGYISIHAPRAGCDCKCAAAGAASPYFNPRTPCGVRLRRQQHHRGCSAISIHAPRAGCDRARQRSTAGTVLFQSTHPVRGATI